MAGKNIKGITIEIGGNTQPLEKALKGVNDSAVKTSKEIKEIDKALKFDPGNIVLLTQKQELLGKQVATNKEKLDTLRQAQSQVEAKFKSGDIGAEQYRAFQREVEQTKNILGGYEGKLESVNQALAGNGQAVSNNTQTMKSLQTETNNLLKADLINDFSDKIAAASDKVVEFGQNSLEAFREVDEGMDIIVTKTGASGDSLDEMSDIAKNLSTSIPTDFETAGSAVGELNTQFGLTGDALQSSSEYLIKFAEINGADVSDSAISAKQAIEAYGLQASDLGNVLDVVTLTSQATGVGVQDLMSKAITGAPQIKQLGLSFDEGVTLMGKFEQAGVDSSGALSSLSKAAVNYAKDGKSLKDGLSETIDKIRNSTDETEALTTASEVFGSKAASRMVDAIKRGTLSFDDLAQAAQNSSGVVGKTYDNTLDPIDKFTTAQNAIKLAMADVGAVIAETLAPIMKKLASIIQDVSKWFSGLSVPVKQFILIVGGLIVVIGALLPVFLALQAAAMAAGTTIGGLLLSFAPIVAIVAAVIAVIALLVVAFKNLWKNNEGFRTAVIGAWNAIYGFLSNIVSTIANFVMGIWGKLTSWWTKNQDLIQSTTKTVWNAIQSAIKTVMSKLAPLIKLAMENIKISVKAAWTIVKIVISTTLDTILGIIKAVMLVINGDWDGAWKAIKETAKNFIEGVYNVIKTWLDALLQIFSNSWNLLKDVVSNVSVTISSVVQSVWSAIVTYLSGVGQSIYTTASSIWQSILSTLSSIWNSIYSTVMSVFNAISTFLSNLWNTISSTASSVWNGIMMTLQFIWNSIYNTVMSIWNAIWNFLSNLWNTISSTVSSIFNGIKNTISNVWNGILETTQNVWSTIKSTIKSMIEGAKNIVSDTIEAMKKLFKFEWSLPRPKIPKFTVSGGKAPWGFGGEGSLPSVDITWFAKGGILTKPTAFGMLGNSVAVGGEAGNEAVLPLNEGTLGMIADRIMATVTEKIIVQVPEQKPQPIVLNVDGKTFAKLMVGYISDEQAQRLSIIENGGTI
ncbi:phage tail tape measure protein [Streptococcus caballi]|uniref:phage tail tape measure protein n=1 Tax=Streptococcus caballi TaxID=439220 RepID=UPI000362EB81|nr:phage tail tape measure protein [Streptococcus caballi]